MATVKLPRLDLFALIRTLVRSKHFTCKRLHCSRRQHAGEFRQMSTAVDAAQRSQRKLAKALQQIETHELRVVRLDRLALTRIRNGPGACFSSDDVELR